MYTSIIHHEIGIRSFIINQYQLTIHWLPKNNYLNSLMYKTIIQLQPLFPIYLKGKIILTMLLFSNLIRSSDSVARTLHWKGKTLKCLSVILYLLYTDCIKLYIKIRTAHKIFWTNLLLQTFIRQKLACHCEELNYLYLNVKTDFFEALMNAYLYKAGKCISSYPAIAIILDPQPTFK